MLEVSEAIGVDTFLGLSFTISLTVGFLAAEDCLDKGFETVEFLTVFFSCVFLLSVVLFMLNTTPTLKL